jgi:DNA repair protein RadC
MSEMALLEQEHLRVMLLDTKNRVLETPTVYIGSLNTSLIRVGELFREAIRANCASLIVLHNHPSGDPTPSPEDVAVTRQIVEAGQLLDVEVLDHLIIGRQRFVSLKERGLGFGP